MRRLGLGVVFAAISVLGIAGIARACDGVSGSVDPSSARAGDPIGYSISGLDPGATYRVTIDGQQVGSGVNGASYGGAGGSFSMPDYGTQTRTVYVTLYASHSEDNFDWDRSFPVQYIPPAPVAAVSQSVAPPRLVQHHRSHSHRPPLPVAVATHAANKQRRDSASTGSAVGAAPADSVGSEPGPRHPTSGSGSAKHSKARSSSVPHAVLHALTSTTRVGPADVPMIGLLLMALIFIAGTGVAAAIIYILQTGPDPRAAIKEPAPLGHDPVEVELQEMIADGMARQLLADLDLVESRPSSD